MKNKEARSVQDVVNDMSYIAYKINYMLKEGYSDDDLDKPLVWAVEIETHSKQLLEDMKNAVNHAKAIAANRERIRMVK